MPITAAELKDLRDQLKNLDQQLEGLQHKAAAEEGRVVPEGEPAPRLNRLR
jgi:hypothetical protein